MTEKLTWRTKCVALSRMKKRFPAPELRGNKYSYLDGMDGTIEAYAHEFAHLIAARKSIQKLSDEFILPEHVSRMVNRLGTTRREETNEVLAVEISEAALVQLGLACDYDAAREQAYFGLAWVDWDETKEANKAHITKGTAKLVRLMRSFGFRIS